MKLRQVKELEQEIARLMTEISMFRIKLERFERAMIESGEATDAVMRHFGIKLVKIDESTHFKVVSTKKDEAPRKKRKYTRRKKNVKSKTSD